MYFGPAGIPLSTQKKTTPSGVLRVADLGLNAMEIEFVYGVRMSKRVAEETRKVAGENGVKLTVHAPYYINLLSDDEGKRKASIQRILESARVGFEAGAWSITFHPGYYGRLSPETAVREVRSQLKSIVRTLLDEGVVVWVRPETMGGLAEFGGLDEILDVVNGLELALPCVDFAHLFARSMGSLNGFEEFSDVLSRIESKLGREALENMHIHMSGIEYGKKGEKRHLTLRESEFNWEEAILALKEYRVKGVLICESPVLEEDAILLMGAYEKASRENVLGRRRPRQTKLDEP